MTRIWTSIGILAVLLGLCICSVRAVDGACARYDAQAAQAEAALSAGDTAGALAACDGLMAEWDRFHGICGIFVTGSRLTPIREELAALRPMIAAGMPESHAGLARLRYRIRCIPEETTPLIWHIL
ncbi:MAG: DUF4363 family protein [Oscillospiraceae bacterium]|nr:DUF4363 family protein [Oscillospiraceae bacterium]